MTAMDDDDSDRPTTAINAAQMRALVAKAGAEKSVVAELPLAPRATEAVAPIVIIVDRPATVIGGLIKSARSAGQRLVTLSKFRALRNEVAVAAPEVPTGPIAKPGLAAQLAARGEPMETVLTLGPPVTLYEAPGGAAVVATEALTITSGTESATLHARPMVSIVGFPKMRVPTERPASEFEPPPEAFAAPAAEPAQRVRTHSEMTRPVMLEPHEGPALQLEAPAPVQRVPNRPIALGTRPIARRAASGVAVVQKPLLDGYALAAVMFIAGAVIWMLLAR